MQRTSSLPQAQAVRQGMDLIEQVHLAGGPEVLGFLHTQGVLSCPMRSCSGAPFRVCVYRVLDRPC